MRWTWILVLIALLMVAFVVYIGQYRKAHGQLPPDLPALIPDYLQELPLDPYDGAPLRYVPAKGIVYAVGEKLIDEGGDSRSLEAGRTDSPDPGKAPDVVYECEPKKT